VLRSIEVNLSPNSEVDMEPASLDGLDIVVGCFHSVLRRKKDQTAMVATRPTTLQQPVAMVLERILFSILGSETFQH
jgi:hypothetical protein